MDWTALWVSVRLASLTTAILFLAGVPLAYWLATSRLRGKFLIEALITLPLILPPTVLGFCLLMASAPDSPLGQVLDWFGGTRLGFTFAGILVASIIYNLPFAVQPFAASFARIDRRLLEASWCLGVSRQHTFWRVTLPLAWPGIMAGLILTFAHAIGEFGVVLMVGGNIPGVTRTLSIAIYDDVQALDYATATRTALLLIGFSLVALAAAHFCGRRKGPP